MVVVGELGVIHSMETSVTVTDSVDELPVLRTGSGAVAASQ